MGIHGDGSAMSVIGPTRALTQEVMTQLLQKGGTGVDVYECAIDPVRGQSLRKRIVMLSSERA